MLTLAVKRLTSNALLPIKSSIEAACWDLHVDTAVKDYAGWTVRTGLAIALPPGYGMFVFPRSGLSTKLGLSLRNSVGVIDSDYRGEIILKFNAGYIRFSDEINAAMQPGCRIAQATVFALPDFAISEVADLPETDRGAGGFGSTGT